MGRELGCVSMPITPWCSVREKVMAVKDRLDLQDPLVLTVKLDLKVLRVLRGLLGLMEEAQGELEHREE